MIMSKIKIGVIGGSGLDDPKILKNVKYFYRRIRNSSGSKR